MKYNEYALNWISFGMWGIGVGFLLIGHLFQSILTFIAAILMLLIELQINKILKEER